MQRGCKSAKPDIDLGSEAMPRGLTLRPSLCSREVGLRDSPDVQQMMQNGLVGLTIERLVRACSLRPEPVSNSFE